MKQLFTLISGLLSACLLQAQVTIGQNEMPHSGDELHRTRATLNPFVNYGATGAGHSWNFASLTAAGEESTEYMSVSATNIVYAFVYADIPFNPNRANLAQAGVDIAFSDLLPIDDPYTFTHRSSSAYATVGFGAALSGIPVPIIFDQRDVIYQLPLNYGNSSTSNSSWKVSLPTLAYYGYRQTRQNQVDGWGAITTPTGIYDALRVKTTIHGSDTINIDTLGLGFAINRPTVRQYKWLSPGIRVPVLEINTAEVLGAEVVTSIYYYDEPHTIAVQQPLATMLCAGAAVTVHYGATGTYNSGSFLIPANKFRVQLSDAEGSFAAPTNIGEVTATATGSINANIPANTPPGTGYRIRVVSTSPAFIGPDNGVDLSIGTAPTASVLANGPVSFCEGGSVQLLATTSPGATLQWTLNGDVIDGATMAELDATASGSFAVQTSNACGSSASTAIDVQSMPLPVHQPLNSFMTACNGGMVSLVAVNTSGATSLAYQWYADGTPVAGGTGAELTTGQSGLYSLEVTDVANGCTFLMEDITVEAVTMDAPQLSAEGAATFCPGGSVMLLAAGQAADYQWLLNGTPVAGASGNSYDAGSAGVYTVVAIGAQGCNSEPSAGIEVGIHPVPETPVVTASGPLSFCAGEEATLTATSVGSSSYLWNNSADGATLTVGASGTYSVVATNEHGCTSAPSAEIAITVHPLPEIPVITAVGDHLSVVDAGGMVQWAFNGEDIPGATGPTWEPDGQGIYTATVTDANGCSSMSVGYVYVHTGITGQHSMGVAVMPNPTNGIFTINLDGGTAGTVFTIFDATGKLVQSGQAGEQRTKVDLAGNAPGLYFLRVEGRSELRVVRIVLE
ncbi:MAG: T9SS type A sorting domain-containing protein [Flavobacteriales bacterium]|nr:T9SS type A sorting domain-containing protein [Flavobacteriales bacterium]